MTNLLPVPLAPHYDGWTTDVQLVFLKTLLTTGSVSGAARSCGRTPAAAYLWRAHPGGAAFKAGWARAIDICMERIRETAIDRALNGRVMPIYKDGVQIGASLVTSDRLLTSLLQIYDAPACRAKRRAAAAAATGPIVRPPSRAELIAQFEVALEQIWLKHPHRATENTEPGMSKESPKVRYGGELGVSKESPKASGERKLGVSKESPNILNGKLGVSKESPNILNGGKLGVSKESPKPLAVVRTTMM